MIDDEFDPDQRQLEALGRLFICAMKKPSFPTMSELGLYALTGYEIETSRPRWFQELADCGLIAYLNASHEKSSEHFSSQDDSIRTDGVCLTPAGIYYCAARAELFIEQERGLTRDIPPEIADGIELIHLHFRPGSSQVALAADRAVSYDHNSPGYIAATDALDQVFESLSKDNVIGSSNLAARDRLIEELQKIRELLQFQPAPVSRLAIMGWGTLGYIMTEFANRPVGHLAEVAWAALKQLLST